MRSLLHQFWEQNLKSQPVHADHANGPIVKYF